MFATRDDLRDLSGYKRKSDIAKWLRENGYVFELDKDEWPKVPRAMIEARFHTKAGGPRLRFA